MATEEKQFPSNWLIAQDYDPNTHLMKLERYDRKAQRMIGNDYLNVQNRLVWFIRDQRALIVAGLAKCPYVVETELVELDRERGWAHYKTFIRDVLGNEATMYGSEAAASFPDYAEKASTKSLGRALLLLGYGTAYAPEIDEGDRVVDSPIEAHTTTPAAQPTQAQARPAPAAKSSSSTTAAKPADGAPRQQLTRAGLEAWLNGKGYLTSDQKVEAFKGAGLPWRLGKYEKYTIEEQNTLAAWCEAHPAPAVPKGDTPTEPMASDRQLTSIRMLCGKLGRPEPTDPLTFATARDLLTQLSRAYSETRQAS
jgi:hypothetical protein